jgi:hypothetical protein
MTTMLQAGATSKKRLAAARYHLALTAGLPLAGTRSPADGPTTGELLLEGSLARAMQPALAEMYRRPIEANLTAMAEQNRDEIARSVLAFYRERPDTLEPARSALARYARQGFEIGGQMGLDELGLPGQFALSDDHIVEVLTAHVGRLTSAQRQAQLSVAVTTADEIGRAVDKQREAGLTVVDMLPALSAWVLGRTVIRSATIAMTETVRMTRWGMAWAFVGNGIRGVRHECAADVERRCNGQCPPLCGTEYELGGVFNPMRGIPSAGQIPLHPGCRCWYSPLTDGWVKPALIWTGFALGLLND